MQPISSALIKAFKRCPICDGDFVDHYFNLLSVTPVWKAETVRDLAGKVKGHQWVAAREISEFDPTQDAVEVFVLRCPGGRLAVVTVDDPYEPYQNPSVLECDVLDNESSRDLSAVMGDEGWGRLTFE